VITVNGFSKSYCMTGWRLGWVAAPAWLAEPVANVRYALSMVAGTPTQWGAVAALSDAARPYYDEVYRTYGERRAYFYDALTKMGLPQRPTAGAFVGMIDIRPTRRSGAEVSERWLRDARVFIWPGTNFGACGEGYLRVGLVKPLDVLKEMMRRIEPLMPDLLAGAASPR
jgi:aminotransferase